MSDTIVEEMEIHVPPARVFAAWTDPQQLLEWWGDEQTYLTTEHTADLKPGGQWISRGRDANGRDFSVSGEYLRVEPPHRLTFTWQSSWDDTPTTVDVEFQAVDSGTLVRLTHSGFTTAQARDNHQQGWQRVIAWLKQYVEGGQANRKAVALESQT